MREDRFLPAAFSPDPCRKRGHVSSASRLAALVALSVVVPAGSATLRSDADAAGRAGAGADVAGRADAGAVGRMVAGDFPTALSLIRAVSTRSRARAKAVGRVHRVGMYNTTTLLSQVQRAAEDAVQGIKLDPTSTEILVSITESLVQEVLPDLLAQHNESQYAVNVSADAVGMCSGTLDGHLASLPTLNATVETARAAHLDCREEHVDANTQRSDAVDLMSQFLDSLEPPPEGCTVPVPEGTMVNTTEFLNSMDVEDWLQSLIDWGATNLADYDQAAEDCVLSEHNMSHTCDTHQMQFESTFCQYREMLTSWCTDYTECYDYAIRVFNETCAEEELSVERLKNEYEALEKILCYLDILTTNFTTLEDQSARLDHCHDLVVDTSILDLYIPEVDEADDCPEELVAIYPGHSDWIPTEYAGYESVIAPVFACSVNSTASGNETH